MKFDCPECSREIEIDYADMEYHNKGRKCKCPRCKKNFTYSPPAKNFKEGKNGSLEKKYKVKK